MLISLGFSCQTRFLIDAFSPEIKRHPFDFNITSRPALIRALATDGASLMHHAGAATTYVMPKEQRQGVEVGGMYFWHDYPLGPDKLALSPDWADRRVSVNGKYAMLWQRFAETLRSDMPKILALSNSQHNLPQFAADEADFDRKFGLGRQAHDEITAALETFGARNWRLAFLSRSAGEVEETADLHDRRLEHRFVGALSLRVAPALATQLISDRPETSAGIRAIEGRYNDGTVIVRAISARVAMIRSAVDGIETTDSAAAPLGSIWAGGDGLVAAFSGRDRVFFVSADAAALSFSDGSRWTRVAD
jgi:hypothetical protein